MTKIIVPLIPEDGIKQRTISVSGKEVLVGDHTGRCFECGSDNLWEDETAYGCSDCDWVRFTGQLTQV